MENNEELNQTQIDKARSFQDIIFQTQQFTMKFLPFLIKIQKSQKSTEQVKICPEQGCNMSFTCNKGYAGHIKLHKNQKTKNISKQPKRAKAKPHKLNNNPCRQEFSSNHDEIYPSLIQISKSEELFQQD